MSLRTDFFSDMQDPEKARLVLIRGEGWQAFPGPRRPLEVQAVPRLPAHKMDRLHAIARRHWRTS